MKSKVERLITIRVSGTEYTLIIAALVISKLPGALALAKKIHERATKAKE
jgi:hypothetical protein